MNSKKALIPKVRGFDKAPRMLTHEECPLLPGARLVYLALISLSWKTGTCWPTLERLAAKTQLSPRSVSTHLVELRNFGLIDWDRGAKGRPNVYTIHSLDDDKNSVEVPATIASSTCNHCNQYLQPLQSHVATIANKVDIEDLDLEVEEDIPEAVASGDFSLRESSAPSSDQLFPRDTAVKQRQSRTKTPTPTAVPTATARETWLTPYTTTWEEVMGGLPPAGMLAKYLRPLDLKHGADKTTAHLRKYLADTKPEFVSLARFAATFGKWSPPSWSSSSAPSTPADLAQEEEILRKKAEARKRYEHDEWWARERKRSAAEAARAEAERALALATKPKYTEPVYSLSNPPPAIRDVNLEGRRALLREQAQMLRAREAMA